MRWMEFASLVARCRNRGCWAPCIPFQLSRWVFPSVLRINLSFGLPLWKNCSTQEERNSTLIYIQSVSVGTFIFPKVENSAWQRGKKMIELRRWIKNQSFLPMKNKQIIPPEFTAVNHNGCRYYVEGITHKPNGFVFEWSKWQHSPDYIAYPPNKQWIIKATGVWDNQEKKWTNE